MSDILLDIQGLQLSLHDLNYPILKNINYQVHKGDYVVLLGGNGSGKSSLIKVMNKTLMPTKGRLVLDNQPLDRISDAQFHKAVITLTQDIQQSFFQDLTVLENCLIWELRHHKVTFAMPTQRERIFFQSYLEETYPSLVDKLDNPIRSLSGGEKQLLLLALCLRYPPKLLLLDEHTSALDPVRARQTMQRTHDAVKAHSITCMMTTHNLDDALAYGNRLLVLKDGHIIFKADYQEKLRLNRQALIDLY